MIFHYNNFLEKYFWIIMFVAYSFTYTMVSASFLRNIPISRYTYVQLYSQICGILLFRLQALYYRYMYISTAIKDDATAEGGGALLSQGTPILS